MNESRKKVFQKEKMQKGKMHNNFRQFPLRGAVNNRTTLLKVEPMWLLKTIILIQPLKFLTREHRQVHRGIVETLPVWVFKSKIRSNGFCNFRRYTQL